MRAAKVQASLRICAVSPEPPRLAHTSSESRGTFRQKVRSLAPLNGWACAVKICHDGMLEDTNSLDGAQLNIFGMDFRFLQNTCTLSWESLNHWPQVAKILTAQIFMGQNYEIPWLFPPTFLVFKHSLANLQNSLTFPWPWGKIKFPQLFPDQWPRRGWFFKCTFTAIQLGQTSGSLSNASCKVP